MHQTLIQRYTNGTLMLMDRRDDAYHFLGTAFIVHSKGYLLTAARLLEGARNLALVNPAQPGLFSPLAVESAAAYGVTAVGTDASRDVALLKMDIGEGLIEAPEDFIGNPETLTEGTYLLAFGVSFGHFRVHNVMAMRAMLSAKILSPNETRLLVYDADIHPGDVGGPLVNVEKGRIVGVIQGSFNPLHFQESREPDDYQLPSGYSYAVSIEYAHPLMEAEGLA